jgi:ketosteroid isomerase-like protein
MPLAIPQPIADYFAVDTKDGPAIAQCFAIDARVIDEKTIYRGRAAIAAWTSEASAKYDYAAEPVTVDDQGDTVVVTSRVTGNFPGSPVDLRYTFTLSNDGIVRLEIGP